MLDTIKSIAFSQGFVAGVVTMVAVVAVAKYLLG